ncbi:MAG: hypothetical protein RLZ98_703 [Pseudomonadota bacterium]|jgi:HCOMODA/2-hydroxy-3-carboxy-muconic semialdehyde decarboxylase
MPDSKTDVERLKRHLVVANRILADQGVVDAFGHISQRHPDRPDRFFLSRSRSPELVEPDDILEFSLDGEVADGRPEAPYAERFIHAGVLAAYPQFNCVVHSHALAVLPFSISSVPLRTVIHTASQCGPVIPVWDSQKRFGDTGLLITDIDQGRDLAAALGNNRAVLMRGHGFTAAGANLVEVLKVSIYLPQNAQVLMDAIRLGGDVKALTEGEIAIREGFGPGGMHIERALEYWARKAGCAHYL